jgi:hypothetical protein
MFTIRMDHIVSIDRSVSFRSKTVFQLINSSNYNSNNNDDTNILRYEKFHLNDN